MDYSKLAKTKIRNNVLNDNKVRSNFTFQELTLPFLMECSFIAGEDKQTIHEILYKGKRFILMITFPLQSKGKK